MNNTINPINSSVSFKATLKTPFQSGVMPEITKEFANIVFINNACSNLFGDYSCYFPRSGLDK